MIPFNLEEFKAGAEVERGKLVGKLQSAGSCILKGKYEPAAEKLAEAIKILNQKV